MIILSLIFISALILIFIMLFNINDKLNATRQSQEHLHEWIKYIHRDLNVLLKQSISKEDFDLYLKRTEQNLKALHDVNSRKADKRWQTYAEAFGSVPKQVEEE